METEISLCSEWPELSTQELNEYFNEIKSNKKLKLDWVCPGRIDPQVYSQYKIKLENLKLIPKNSENEIAMENQEVKSAAVDINDLSKFDICNEFGNEDTVQPNDLFKLQNKTIRNIAMKKVACIDKILDNMRKTYENDKQLEQEEEDKVKQQEAQKQNIQTNIEETTSVVEADPVKPVEILSEDNVEAIVEISVDNMISKIEQSSQLNEENL